MKWKSKLIDMKPRAQNVRMNEKEISSKFDRLAFLKGKKKNLKPKYKRSKYFKYRE